MHRIYQVLFSISGIKPRSLIYEKHMLYHQATCSDINQVFQRSFSYEYFWEERAISGLEIDQEQ